MVTAPGSAVIFGAGSVGRGFIGQLMCRAGYRVTFIDVDPRVVAALAQDGSYRHVSVSDTRSETTVVSPVTAINAGDADAVVAAVANADLAATAVGAAALPSVAAVLARATAQRIAEQRPPLNVLLCENVHDVGSQMRDIVIEQSPQLRPEQVTAALGFIETSIGRMIPVAGPAAHGDPTVVFAEPFDSLPYDGAAVLGAPLQVPGLEYDPSVGFAFYTDRKLYVHNLGHTMTAYLGRRLGVELICEAIIDPAVRFLVRGAMIEASMVLASDYDRGIADLIDHVDDLVHRFGNRALADTVARVGRDPERKTAADDRLLGPYRRALKAGSPARFLSLGVALGADALADDGWSDAQVGERLDQGLSDVSPTSQQRQLLAAQIDTLSRGSVADQIMLIDQTFENQP